MCKLANYWLNLYKPVSCIAWFTNQGRYSDE